MKYTSLTILILLFISIKVIGQNTNLLTQQFDTLLIIDHKDKITESDLIKSWEITQELFKARYTDYIENIKNNTSYVSHSLTKTYSDICRKADSSLSVKYYLKYMELTKGSAEEELSFGLERILVKYPRTLLDKIGKDEYLLSSLAWGFLNNRYYGVVNPYENEDYTAMTIYENGPKPMLNSKNCKEIFYQTNPTLLKNYEQYKYQIDFIINSAKLELGYETE